MSRGYLVVFVLFVLGVTVGYRLVSLQLTQGDKYRALAEKRSIKNVEVLPVRGNIYSEDGSLLATSVSKYSIHFDAVTVSERVFQQELGALSDSLAKLLGNSSNYYTKLAPSQPHAATPRADQPQKRSSMNTPASASPAARPSQMPAPP